MILKDLKGRPADARPHSLTPTRKASHLTAKKISLIGWRRTNKSPISGTAALQTVHTAVVKAPADTWAVLSGFRSPRTIAVQRTHCAIYCRTATASERTNPPRCCQSPESRVQSTLHLISRLNFREPSHRRETVIRDPGNHHRCAAAELTAQSRDHPESH